MDFSLALYDPSQPAVDGSFWSWRSAKLPRKHLDRLYYEVAVANRPADPGQISPTDFHGGFACFGDELIFGYRFGNGGRDAHGRKGRFIMIVAGVSCRTQPKADLLKIMTSGPVDETLRAAESCCPVPPPPHLDFAIAPSLQNASIQKSPPPLRDGKLELREVDAWTRAATLCSTFPPGLRWICRMGSSQGLETASIELFNAPTIPACPAPPNIPIPPLRKPKEAPKIPRPISEFSINRWLVPVSAAIGFLLLSISFLLIFGPLGETSPDDSKQDTPISGTDEGTTGDHPDTPHPPTPRGQEEALDESNPEDDVSPNGSQDELGALDNQDEESQNEVP